MVWSPSWAPSDGKSRHSLRLDFVRESSRQTIRPSFGAPCFRERRQHAPRDVKKPCRHVNLRYRFPAPQPSQQLWLLQLRRGTVPLQRRDRPTAMACIILYKACRFRLKPSDTGYTNRRPRLLKQMCEAPCGCENTARVMCRTAGEDFSDSALRKPERFLAARFFGAPIPQAMGVVKCT